MEHTLWQLDIIITVPFPVCSASHGWTVKLPESNCANTELASAFTLLLVLHARFMCYFNLYRCYVI